MVMGVTSGVIEEVVVNQWLTMVAGGQQKYILKYVASSASVYIHPYNLSFKT